jgi:raffinose/stachyose/melibiose transport system substrate-binding protein
MSKGGEMKETVSEPASRWLQRFALAAAVGALALGVTACSSDDEDANSSAPTKGAAVKPKIDPNEKITLTVWHWESVRVPVLEKLTESFEQKYPNVSVKLVQRDFGSYPAQVKLVLSGRDAPDVAQGNQGYSLDSTLVEAKLVRPLDDYAKGLGWMERYPESVRRQWQFSEDGKYFGRGPLWGISAVGELGGWYYNKEKLKKLGLEPPKTLAEFEQALDKAKTAGELPIMLGNVEAWPATHIFNTILNQMVPIDMLNGIVFTDPDAQWDAPPFKEAAAKLQEWAQNGYFPEGYDGLGYDDATVRFGKGEGVFMQCGSWCTAQIADELKDKAGYFLPPPIEEGEPSRATGSFSAPWHIATKSEHPEAAALWIEWNTNQEASQAYAQIGDLPGLDLGTPPYEKGSVSRQVYDAWTEINKTENLIPYLDWSTPTTGSVYYAALQELMAGKIDPAEALGRVQEDREEFFDKTGVFEG